MTNVTTEVISNTTLVTSSWNNQSNTTTQIHTANEDSRDIPKDVADDILFAIQCVIMPVLVTFGITGSLLSLIVLLHKTLRTSSTSVLLIGLAISDGLFLITTIIRKPTCIISRFDPDLSYRYFTLSFISMFYTTTCFSRVSTLLVAAISVERLIAVMWPLKVRLICTRTRVVVTVIAVFVFTFGILALLPAQYKIEYVNETPILVLNELHHSNAKFFDIYNRYITLVVFRWLPKFVVVICNVVIITSLWKRRVPSENLDNLTSLDNYTKTQRKVTVMLVTVAVVFVITLLPGDVFLILSQAIDGFKIYGEYNNLFLVLSDVSLAFEIVNSSVNFIIYMALNTMFSGVYLVLFCPCLSRTKRLLYTRSERQMSNSAVTVQNPRNGLRSSMLGVNGTSTKNVDVSIIMNTYKINEAC